MFLVFLLNRFLEQGVRQTRLPPTPLLALWMLGLFQSGSFLMHQHSMLIDHRFLF
uniref:Uncharacterized protein n=1 Tax=uncultured marine virus TaxID=186617 RepID=A0A0F7L961_9VIRU|nr:hypothetical protein [uncultured marine virus]